MTTAPPSPAGFSGSGVLAKAGLVTLAVGVVSAVLAGVVTGASGAAGVAVGVAILLVVFGGGAFFVNLVAGVIPTASLLIAMLTYTLQVLVMALVLVALSRSGLLDDTLDRRWLAGSVIVGTFVWLTAQVVLVTRARIPAFALEEADAR